ncbi:MAG TPA: rhomboid family intramembrane serine protease [Mycobacteriales bacterium]|jgi:membrane associated rhomboid family serine protease|nr:rhomboid family intramembrane serine protease [Mycobacteriales bacterium]
MTLPDAPGAQEARAPTCYRHPDRQTYISCVRCGRSICPECMRPAAVGFQCPEEVKEAQRSVRQPRTAFGGRVSAGRNATTVLVALNVVVFLILVGSGTGFISGSISLLFARFADIPGRVVVIGPNGAQTVLQGVANGDYYRLVTAMFLHFGVIHLALNMYVLMLVGPTLEQSLGRVRFLALYFIAGIGGSVATFVFGSPTEIAAGASGAIFGLFGGYYVIARRIGASTGPIVATIVLNLVISFSVTFIDVRAHLGGLVTGAAVAAVLAYAPTARRTVVQAGGSLAILALLLGLAAVHAPSVRRVDRSAPVAAVPVSLPAPASRPGAPPQPPAPAATR